MDYNTKIGVDIDVGGNAEPKLKSLDDAFGNFAKKVNGLILPIKEANRLIIGNAQKMSAAKKETADLQAKTELLRASGRMQARMLAGTNKLLGGKAQKLVEEATQTVKLGQKYDSFGGSLRMSTDEWTKFNKRGGQFDTIGGKIGNKLRMMTHGLRRFKMEMLGVMFFGMGMQKFFTGLLRPAAEAAGFFDLISTILTVLFVPVMIQVIDLLMPFFEWLLNLSDGAKTFIGWAVILGAAFGTFLYLIGTISLGIGSLIQVFGSVFGLIGSIGSAIGGLLGPIGSLVIGMGLFAAIVPAVEAFNTESQKGGGIWETLKSILGGTISSIISWVDSLWEKFLSWGPIKDALEAMGVNVEALKNPVEIVKDKISGMWRDWLLENPEVFNQLAELQTKAGQLYDPFWSISTLLSVNIKKAFDDLFSGLEAKFPTLIENIGKVGTALQSILDILLKVGGAIPKFDLKDVGLVGTAVGVGGLVGGPAGAIGGGLLSGLYLMLKNALMTDIEKKGYGATGAFAEGGIVTHPTLATIGERGPEAIVPLIGGGIGGSFTLSPTIYLTINPASTLDIDEVRDSLSNQWIDQLNRLARSRAV